MRLRRPLCALLGALTLVSAAPAVAPAIPKLPAVPVPVAHNPADELRSQPIEDAVYETASRCTPKPRPGTTKLVDWLGRNAAGVSWGTYRCEKWGKDSASLHAEGRAVD